MRNARAAVDSLTSAMPASMTQKDPPGEGHTSDTDVAIREVAVGGCPAEALREAIRRSGEGPWKDSVGRAGGVLLRDCELGHTRRLTRHGPARRRRPARCRAAELLQLVLDQCGELMRVRQRVRVGIAAEEELLPVAHHPDRERVPLGDGNDRVDLLELAAQEIQRSSRRG